MVVKNLDQLEKNVSASFGYVKKDILMVNDAISNVHDKIQHLSLNHAMLLEKLDKIENLLSGKKPKKVSKKAPKKAKTAKAKKAPKKATAKKEKKTISKTPKKVITETLLYE